MHGKKPPAVQKAFFLYIFGKTNVWSRLIVCCKAAAF